MLDLSPHLVSGPKQLLYETRSQNGHLAVYHTSSFGRVLSMNDEIILSEKDNFFYDEMISHPALFTHPHPKKIVIVGHYHGTLQEVLKHSTVSEVWCVSTNTVLEQVIFQYFSSLSPTKQDERVKNHTAVCPWAFLQQSNSRFDMIIHHHCSSLYVKKELATLYQTYYRLLEANGMLIQPCLSSLLHPFAIKTIIDALKEAGFKDGQPLNFPQPSYKTGTRTLLLSTKDPINPARIREKDIYNRCFSTRYYNYDTHRAALAVPEFVRETLRA